MVSFEMLFMSFLILNKYIKLTIDKIRLILKFHFRLRGLSAGFFLCFQIIENFTKLNNNAEKLILIPNVFPRTVFLFFPDRMKNSF